MQGVYYPEKSIPVSEKEFINILGFHDEYSMWFSAFVSNNQLSFDPTEAYVAKNKAWQNHVWFFIDFSSLSRSLRLSPDRPSCTCGSHMILSRTRISQLNDLAYWQTYYDAINQVINFVHSDIKKIYFFLTGKFSD